MNEQFWKSFNDVFVDDSREGDEKLNKRQFDTSEEAHPALANMTLRALRKEPAGISEVEAQELVVKLGAMFGVHPRQII